MIRNKIFRFFEKLIKPYPDQMPDLESVGLFPFLWQSTRGIKRYLAAMCGLSMLNGIFDALLFLMLGVLVDWLSTVERATLWADKGGMILLWGGIILASIVLVAVIALLKNQVLNSAYPMRLRWDFHRVLLNQSMDFFQNEFAGRVSAKVMQTSKAVQDVCMVLVEMVTFVATYIIGMFWIAGGFHAWLLPPFVMWMLVYAVLLIFYVPRLSETARAQADGRSLLNGRITDAYTNIATVKLFSHAGREAGYAKSAMQDFMKSVHAHMRLLSSFTIINYTLGMLLIMGCAGSALYLWGAGSIGTGAVAAAVAMALRLNQMSSWLIRVMMVLFEQIGTVYDGMGVLSKVPVVQDSEDAPPLEVSEGEIQFNDVTFSYHKDSKEPVINNFNLTIKAGERIGLVGRSGVGKSTLVNLLLRFYDIDKGEVLIDGKNIAHVEQDSLRAQIGMVTQDTSLLHRTVRENIMYGRPNATEEEMIVASQQAEATGFIDKLVDKHKRKGYDVLVGERGVKLSGGQRQRIAIARVMLKDAPILMLDEATSALDSEVEQAIQGSLNKLMKGKTVIAIAHRLSTIAAMDRLIVMDKGHIVEQGTHEELLALKGIYASLWERQSGGFLAE